MLYRMSFQKDMHMSVRTLALSSAATKCSVMAYLVMACLVMAYLVMAYLVMAYLAMV